MGITQDKKPKSPKIDLAAAHATIVLKCGSQGT